MGNPAALLHCYGKLPLVEEFLQYQLEVESRAVSAWIDSGHRLVTGMRGPSGSTTPEDSAVGSRRYAYAFDSGKGGKIALGILHDSSDRTGTRRFPFSFFATVDAAGYRSRPALIPFLFQEAWQALDREMAPFGDLRNSQELHQAISGMALSVPGPTEEAAKGLTARLAETKTGDLWKALLPGATSARRVQVLDLVVRALQPYVKSKPKDLPVILKLPVSGTFEETSFQTAFWVELLQRMLGGTKLGPNVFLSLPGPGQPPTSVQVFFQAPDDRNFACLMARRYEAEYVNDLTVELKVALPGSVISERGRKILESDDASVTDLVGFAWC